MSRATAIAFALLTLAGPAAAQTDSPAGPVPVSLLRTRREKLISLVGTGVVILRSADERDADGRDYAQDNDFRQDNDFFYLTGLETAHSWLVLVARDTGTVHAILFVPPRDSLQEKWTGPTLGPGPEIGAIAGIADVRSSEDARGAIRALVLGGKSPARNGTLAFKRDASSLNEPVLRELYAGPIVAKRLLDLRDPLASLRLVKDEDELRRLREASGVSVAGHLAAWRLVKPGVLERELEAAAEAEFRRGGAERLAYPSIVGAGFHSTTLHYDLNRGRANAGDLIVMDMGAEFGYYDADITRTVPASGTFSPHQRAIYDLVFATQQVTLDSIRPGITIGALDRISHEYMRQHSGDLCGSMTCDRYYIHSISHWIGMDVHDVGDRSLPLVPGMVLSVEPGIYLPSESLGVRIEDVVAVTTTGFEMISKGLPRTAADVERYLREHRP